MDVLEYVMFTTKDTFILNFPAVSLVHALHTPLQHQPLCICHVMKDVRKLLVLKIERLLRTLQFWDDTFGNKFKCSCVV